MTSLPQDEGHNSDACFCPTRGHERVSQGQRPRAVSPKHSWYPACVEIVSPRRKYFEGKYGDCSVVHEQHDTTVSQHRHEIVLQFLDPAIANKVKQK